MLPRLVPVGLAGVFFAFSTFVMKALGQLPPTQGVAAMQRINIVVLNPMFLGTFVGTAVLQALVAVLALPGWGSRPSTLLLIGAGLYIVGCFGVTIACNVPRNDWLMALTAEAPAAHEYLAHLPARVDGLEPRPDGGGTGGGGLRSGRAGRGMSPDGQDARTSGVAVRWLVDEDVTGSDPILALARLFPPRSSGLTTALA